jgi:hypothetical protein
MLLATFRCRAAIARRSQRRLSRITAQRRSTMRSSWFAKEIMSTASRGSSNLISWWDDGFLQNEIAPANSSRAALRPFGIRGHQRTGLAERLQHQLSPVVRLEPRLLPHPRLDLLEGAEDGGVVVAAREERLHVADQGPIEVIREDADTDCDQPYFRRERRNGICPALSSESAGE